MESALRTNCSYLYPLMLQSSKGYRSAFCFFYSSPVVLTLHRIVYKVPSALNWNSNLRDVQSSLLAWEPDPHIRCGCITLPSPPGLPVSSSPWSPIHPSHHVCSYIFKHTLGHVKQHLQGLVLAGKSEDPSMMLQPQAPVSLHAPRSHHRSPQGSPSSIGLSVATFPRKNSLSPTPSPTPSVTSGMRARAPGARAAGLDSQPTSHWLCHPG